MRMTVDRDPAKDAVGRAAAELVESGMCLGLGSGSTFVTFLDHLARRVRESDLHVTGVPTSAGTSDRARALGISLTTLEETPHLDLAIDGADEVDPHKHMIKGGGAALAREKIVASAAAEMIVMVGESKMVEVLGKEFLLPVEVLPFGWGQCAARLRDLGCETQLRQIDGAPLRTDNDNYILDCDFRDGVPDPESLEKAINVIPGVLDNGLFTNMAGRVLVGNGDGQVRVVL